MSASAHIATARFASAAGHVLIGVTPRGVCFLALGEHEPPALDIIQRYYPQARIAENTPAAKKYERSVQQFLAGETVDVALDVRGTPFQRTVWKALQNIPRGNTISYSELAEAIDQPRAVRAAASACASNPVSLFVPCHRVLGKAGNLSGYAWGLAVKDRLLALEGARARRQGARASMLSACNPSSNSAPRSA